MRTVAAILFSVLLLITQGLATLVPGHLVNPSTCCGCGCTQRACCNTVPRPTSQPTQPLDAQRAAASAQKLAQAPVTVQSLPPASSLRECSFAPSASSCPPALPLYRRHCALLL